MVGADQARDRDESRNINPPSAFSCLPQDSLPFPFPSPLSPQVSSSAWEWTARFCARQGEESGKKSTCHCSQRPGTGRTVPQDAVCVPGTGRTVPQDLVPALQRERTYGQSRWRGGKERMGHTEGVPWKRMHYHTWDREPVGLCCVTQGTQTGLCDDLEGWDGGREAQRGGTSVHLWLIRTGAWQKPTQYCNCLWIKSK